MATRYPHTNHPDLRYDIREANDAEVMGRELEDLETALDQRVTQFTVLFLDMHGRPTPVFRLYHSPFASVNKPGSTVSSLRISMEPDPRAGGPLADRLCQIQLLCDTGLYYPATVMFRFNLLNPGWHLTVRDFVDAITGKHEGLEAQELRGDMTDFSFVSDYESSLPGTQYYNGYRDWISLAFMRFYSLGWVEWEVADTIVPSDVEEPPIPVGVPPEKVIGFGVAGITFKDIIEKFFYIPPLGTMGRPTPVVCYGYLPLTKGVFRDRTVERIWENRFDWV